MKPGREGVAGAQDVHHLDREVRHLDHLARSQMHGGPLRTAFDHQRLERRYVQHGADVGVEIAADLRGADLLIADHQVGPGRAAWRRLISSSVPMATVTCFRAARTVTPKALGSCH